MTRKGVLLCLVLLLNIYYLNLQQELNRKQKDDNPIGIICSTQLANLICIYKKS